MQKIIDAINVKKQAGNILSDVVVECVKGSKNGQEIIQFDFACKYTSDSGELIDHQVLTANEATLFLKDTLVERL